MLNQKQLKYNGLKMTIAEYEQLQRDIMTV